MQLFNYTNSRRNFNSSQQQFQAKSLSNNPSKAYKRMRRTISTMRNLLLITIFLIDPIACAPNAHAPQTPPSIASTWAPAPIPASAEVVRSTLASTMLGAQPITLSTTPVAKPVQQFGPPPGSVGIQQNTSNYPALVKFEVDVVVLNSNAHAAIPCP